MTLLTALDHFLEAASVAAKWRSVRAIESRLEKQIAKAFAIQGKMFLSRSRVLKPKFNEAKRLREALTDDDWVGIWDDVAKETVKYFLAPLQNAVQLSLTAAAEELIGELEVDYAFDLANPLAVTYIEEHGAELVTGINETTREYLRTIIHQGIDEGWSYDRMARAITARFAEFAVGRPQEHIKSRAHLISITEVGQAYEAGNEIVVRDLVDAGLRMEKSWSTVGDNRVDPHCKENEAQGWIPFDEPFGDGSMRPLAHPACRCTALYRRARGSE